MPGRFKNPWTEGEPGLLQVLRWKLGLAGRLAADFPDARSAATSQPLTIEQLHAMPSDGWRVTWLGHASFLLSGCGIHLLIDPIFSDHCAPLPMAGFKRKAPPPCTINQLPPVAAVLLTHTHYDHCDLPTLRRLGVATPLIVPRGHSRWFARIGFTQVTELGWWENLELSPEVRVTATPAQHFSARSLWDRNRGHWCGWCITGGGVNLWHSGDSGHCPAFGEIGERLGPIDFGMIAIGAYQPRWFMRLLHMNPAEAVQAFLDTRCHRAVGMHWGTFRLSDEPLGEPPLLLRRHLLKRKIAPEQFDTGAIGQQWNVPPRLDSDLRPGDPTGGSSNRGL